MTDEEFQSAKAAGQSGGSPSAWRKMREKSAPEGRRPSYDSAGKVRGFRSRPGAPLSPRDSMAGKSIPNNPEGGLTDAGNWSAFFGGNSPTGVRGGAMPASPAIASAAFPNAPRSPLPNTNLFPRPQTSSGVPMANASSFMDRLKTPTVNAFSPRPAANTGYLDNVVSSALSFLNGGAKGGSYQDQFEEALATKPWLSQR